MTAAVDIPTFANAAALANRISFPQPGQQCVLQDTGLLVYAGPIAGWRKPWNLAWGSIRHVEISSPVAVASTATWGPSKNFEIAGLVITDFLPVYNRLYEIVFDGGVGSNTNGDIIDLRIVMSNNLQSAPGSSGSVIMGMTAAIDMAGISWNAVRFCYRSDSTVGALVGTNTPIDPTVAVLRVGVANHVALAAGSIVGTGGTVNGDANGHSSLTINDLGPSGPPG